MVAASNPDDGTRRETSDRTLKATLALQVKDLGLLQTLAGERELLYQHTLGTEAWKGWRSSPPCNVISTRSILLSEVVFDLDSENWKSIYEEGTKLVRYLRDKRIPFVLGHSGGKGVHVHILIDPTSYQFSEELGDNLKEYGVDVWNEVRSFLAGYLAGEAGLNQERAKLDWRKVKWSSGKKGSLVRTWGCPRPDGGYKTLIEDIPPQRPEPASLPLMFPSSYGLWNISKLSPNLDGLFRSKLRACKDSTIRASDVSASELDEYPCYAGLRKGLPEGLRNEGAFILSAFNRMKNVPLEQAETVLADYSRASAGYSPSVEGEHIQTLRSVYGSEYRHPCCRKVRDVNEALCDRRTCPLYAPKPVELVPEGDKPHPFTFGHQSALRAGLISPDERTVDVQLTAEYILEHQAFVNLQEGTNVSLWYYEDGVYLPLGEDKAARLCEELLMKNASTRTVNEIVNKMRRMLEPRKADDGNAEGWVCVENGYLNVFERTLEPQHPGRVFLTRMPVEYNPSAECPRTLAFLRAITDLKTDPDALLEVIGYCLMPHHRFHWMPILLGEGENGKGTLLALITALLGRDNVSSATLHDLGENKFAKADLYGKMANICGDLDAADLKVTGPLKGLTGGDQIRAERKGQHPFTFVNRAKIIASCNRIPYTKDDTRGFTRRPRVFLFPNTFSGDKKDPDILDKMTTPEELSGLLNEALAGLGRLIDSRGALTGRENEDAEIERYVTMQDSASRFLNLFCMEDKLRYDEGGRALSLEKQGKKDLYEIYQKWCKGAGFAVQSDKAFSKAVRTIFPNVMERKWGSDCVDSPNSRCWVGLIYDE
jgi:P4 family phage/plasmid primase-like protien